MDKANARYILRHFYDAGSGICLWSANERARQTFGYPVELNQLPLTPGLIAEGQRLIELYDTSLDWDYPPDPSPWNQEQWDEFNAANKVFVQDLQRQLGKEFVVLNKT